MKKILFAIVVTTMLVGCVNDNEPEVNNFKRVKIAVGGDMDFIQTRLAANDKEMTDLWVFDYIGTELMQTVHQTPSDENWGSPEMMLAYGDHTLYFVASRGSQPTVTGTVIKWGGPSDTFWNEKTATVGKDSPANLAVTLQRVSTRLRVKLKDFIPAEMASVTIAADTWYNSIDYKTGMTKESYAESRQISIPEEYKETTGQLTMSLFGLSDSGEWVTNVTLTAKDNDGKVIGTATIEDVPFDRNRTSDYTGYLFGKDNTVDVTLDDTWEESYTDKW
jgi:hypothetical protein